ncbi:hypothetical protein NDU88_003426 [Pleurodeles waltl]|uniref:Uncharacterized protein n=1 Tax=Pleurodeles waltl TaxID=8319 RepID=A0AAV7W625_PLEWA|nr:hypothetical protein NDU88_003426 [Pleurodeles waltl]
MDSKERRLASLACIMMVQFLKMAMFALPWNDGELEIVSLQPYGMLVDLEIGLAGAISPLRPDFQALRPKRSDPSCLPVESGSRWRSTDESGLPGRLGSLQQMVYPGRDRLPIGSAPMVG